MFYKIIVFLFEKYALNRWAEEQEEENKRRIMYDQDLYSDKEYYEYLSEMKDRLPREAYYAGKEDGYNQALNEHN